jgi:hypothetical protein
MAAKTGYAVCLDMLAVLARQIDIVSKAQGAAKPAKSLTSTVHNLARSVAVLQAEMRKSKEDAQATLDADTPEERLERILYLIKGLSPEHRGTVSQFCDELGSGLHS